MLVTGGAGFIGSHLVDALLAQGARVRVLDNLSQGASERVPGQAELIVGDITDFATCERAMRGVEGVFHLAAMSRVAPSIERFEYCTQQNVIGTQNILRAARDAQVRKLIYSGSSSCYGNRPPPQSEDLLPECLNPYALSKLIGEQFCSLFTRLYGLPTLSLRYFNVYGPRQPETGAYALVMGIFLHQKRRGEPLTMCGDGSNRRDFIHVQDVVAANLAAFRSVATGLSLNIGSGSSTSISELARMIDERPYRLLPERPGDALATQADLTLSLANLNWRPRISLREGLASFAE